MVSVSNIDAVILCGGFGKRVRKILGKTPKVLAQINNHPFLRHLVLYLKKEGCRRLILCTGYQADLIQKYFKKNAFGLTIVFSKEKTPLGTGGAIKHASRFIKSNYFFVLNGDSYCPVDLKDLLKFHIKKRGVACVVIAPVKEKKDYGGVIINKENRILAFLEKRNNRSLKYVNAGIYCFEKKVFNSMPAKKNFSLEYDCFPKLVRKGIYGFKVKKSFWDIGTPKRYREALIELPSIKQDSKSLIGVIDADERFGVGKEKLNKKLK